VKIDLIENDFNIGLKKLRINIENIDSHLSIRYSKDDLNEKLL